MRGAMEGFFALFELVIVLAKVCMRTSDAMKTDSKGET